MNYYIQDFTENNFRHLLSIAKNVNTITTYEGAKEDGIVFRHDVDYSLNRAVSLSYIEKENSIPSYYFVHMHSDFYNAYDSSSKSYIQRLVENDRIVGLHFEPCYYNLSTEQIVELEERINREKEILEDITGKSVTYMSFHNPDVGGDWFDLPYDKIGGLTNVYGPRIKGTFEYCSDSNGYWRFKRLEEVLINSSGKRIQILTHPGWWQKEVLFPYDRIKRCVMGRAEKVLKLYEENLEKCGRINVKRDENDENIYINSYN